MSVRAGVLYGVAACLLWGVLPLYFRLVDEAGPIEVIAHRAVWSLVVLVALLVVVGRLGSLARVVRDRRSLRLLAAAGPVTAVPLLLFGACVTRVPLTTVGLLQYLVPVLQFLIGWVLLGEHMTVARWVGFALVWLALSLLARDALRATRPRPRPLPA